MDNKTISSVVPATSAPGVGHEAQVFFPLLPLKNVIMLPKSINPIIVGRTNSIKAVEFALEHGKTIFVTTQKEQDKENLTVNDVFTYGTRSTILQVMRMPNGGLKILVEGICRARIIEPCDAFGTEFLGVICQDIESTGIELTTELEALWRQVKILYASYSKLNEKTSSDLSLEAKSAQDMDYLSDIVAAHISGDISMRDRQKMLEIIDLKERLLFLCSILAKEIEILQTEIRIRGRIQTQVEKSQREYYLNEQMKAIQQELGREDQFTEITNLREKLQGLTLPADAMTKVEKELKRLEQMPPFSSEAVVSRHYVDWILGLPWSTLSKDTVSIIQAERLLNKNHAGLKKVKERIIEFLAAKKFSKKLERSPIICLVGPPGVGKTSLARSIAQSMGREFVRISLGGVRDEAEIRGHRRTYIGALPGKIVQAMRKAATMNPVILLDEVDKMSRDVHGDPASALLEVLDPEQNSTFMDHFLDTEFDLSKVMFIATANVMENIPYPLFDRMELITLAGYTDYEKISIAQNFLIPKGLQEYGLTTKQFKLSVPVLQAVLAEYTKEAGVRQLERVITKLMRKTIQKILKNDTTTAITPGNLKDWLGHPQFRKTSLTQIDKKIGLAIGLAWTEVGGDVLEIEASVMPGKGTLTLTGQLGEVMQESAQAALSYVRARATLLGLTASFHTSKDIHIHIPEGATPKDGPSAGIAICSAMISALTKTTMQPYLAMTGEITLQGRVLAVGGLKEKLLAAQQHNITKVLVPKECVDDIKEIQTEVELDKLNIVFVDTMDEVLQHVFIISPLLLVRKKKKKKKIVKAPAL